MSIRWKPAKPPYSAHKKKIFREVTKTANFIYHIGEADFLRKPSREILLEEIKTSIFKQKLNYLIQCLFDYRKRTGMGKGIAAVQVGIPERFAVIYTPELPRKYTVIINPFIIKESEKKLLYSEICMSAAPLSAPVVRPSWIECMYFDEKGKQNLWKGKDNSLQNKIYNRVLQHEIDHMDGIINIDRVQSKDLIFSTAPAHNEKPRFKKIP